MLEANVRSNLRGALARNPAARVASWTLKRGAEAAARLGPAAVLFPWLLPAQVAPAPCPLPPAPFRAPSPRSLRRGAGRVGCRPPGHEAAGGVRRRPRGAPPYGTAAAVRGVSVGAGRQALATAEELGRLAAPFAQQLAAQLRAAGGSGAPLGPPSPPPPPGAGGPPPPPPLVLSGHAASFTPY
jgi:hypothetical protein